MRLCADGSRFEQLQQGHLVIPAAAGTSTKWQDTNQVHIRLQLQYCAYSTDLFTVRYAMRCMGAKCCLSLMHSWVWAAATAFSHTGSSRHAMKP